MKVIEITGDNYCGTWERSRTACRAIVVENGRILLSYAQVTDQWMTPGGGIEPGEDAAACCVREVEEETGFCIRPSACGLEIVEYYGDRQIINRYFFAKITGQGVRKPTDAEIRLRMEPRWIPVEEAFSIFSRYEAHAGKNETTRGLYLREYTALREMLGAPDGFTDRQTI